MSQLFWQKRFRHRCLTWFSIRPQTIFIITHFWSMFLICPLKTPANQRFSRVFRVHKIGTLTGNGINKFAPSFFHATQQFPQNRDDRAGNYMLKVNNRNTRTKCKLCSKLAVRRKQLHFLLQCCITLIFGKSK